MKKQVEEEEEEGELLLHRIANPYEVKSYHKPHPYVEKPTDEAADDRFRESEKQQQAAQAKRSAEGSSDRKRKKSPKVRPLQSAATKTVGDYFENKAEMDRRKKEQLKEDFEEQIRLDKERRLKALDQKRNEEVYWEEKAKRELAVLQKRYEAEKTLENKRTIRSIAIEEAPKQQPDSLDRLRIEIFKKDAVAPNQTQPVFLTAPSKIGYDDIQRQVQESAQADEFYSSDHRHQEAAPDQVADAADPQALDSEGIEEQEGGSVVQDRDIARAQKVDYDEELANFREARAVYKRDFGEVQRPYHDYLRDHQELYRLGDATETKVFDRTKIIKAAPDELQEMLRENQQLARKVPHVKSRLTNNHSSPEDRVISHLESEAHRRQEELGQLARYFRSEVLESEMRRDYIEKEAKAFRQQVNLEDMKARMDGLASETAYKGMHLTIPKLNLLADVRQTKNMKNKYTAFIASSKQAEALPAIVEWEYLKAKRNQDNLMGFYKGLSKADLHWVDTSDEQLLHTLDEIDRLV